KPLTERWVRHLVASCSGATRLVHGDLLRPLPRRRRKIDRREIRERDAKVVPAPHAGIGELQRRAGDRLPDLPSSATRRCRVRGHIPTPPSDGRYTTSPAPARVAVCLTVDQSSRTRASIYPAGRHLV